MHRNSQKQTWGVIFKMTPKTAHRASLARCAVCFSDFVCYHIVLLFAYRCHSDGPVDALLLLSGERLGLSVQSYIIQLTLGMVFLLQCDTRSLTAQPYQLALVYLTGMLHLRQSLSHYIDLLSTLKTGEN